MFFFFFKELDAAIICTEGQGHRSNFEASEGGLVITSPSCYQVIFICISDEELDDSGDPSFSPAGNGVSDSDSDMEIQPPPMPPMPPKRKRRWTEEENNVFKNYFKDYINRKTLPPGSVIKKVQTKLNRSVAQIRTRIHNILTGKQVV